MIFTPFAGLTALDENDPITINGSDFVIENPRVIDHFLRIGCVTHRHNAHGSLPSPSAAIRATAVSSGGSLQASAALAVTYTVVDTYGGETLPAPPTVLDTLGAVADPSTAPTAVVDHTQGILPAGAYYYAKTFTDGAGGETLISPSVYVYVNPGFSSAAVLVGDLTDGMPAGGTVRLWRSDDGADFHLVVEQTANTFLDDGFDPPDNPAEPPLQNTTNQTGSVVCVLPTAAVEPALASGVLINVYLGSDAEFLDPSYHATFPVSSAGASFTISDGIVSQGSPPPVSRSIPGAALIDPDTDILAWPWKRTVATVGALPAAGNTDGDARVVLATRQVVLWNAGTSAWEVYAPGGGGAGADGWTDDTAETWTYASASSFTVPTDLTAKYTLGTYIKLTQGGVVNYFVVTGSSVAAGVTTVKITGGSDYTLANSPITANFHSYMANPQGWPGWFNWSAAPTGFSSITAHLYRFCVVGQMCTFQLTIIGTSNATTLAFTLPIKADRTIMVPGYATDNGVAQTLPASILISGGTATATVSKDMAGAAWTGAGGKQLTATISYSIASL